MTKAADTAREFFGEKLYQVRARATLPILVRQAWANKPIYYDDLAQELGMPNPRNLDYVLGSVGKTINLVSKRENFSLPIPHIQSLVINRRYRIPGSGFDGFLASKKGAFNTLTRQEKREYLEGYYADIFAFPYWERVLAACGLKPAQGHDSLLESAAHLGRRGGEGPEHAALKARIANNPGLIGLPSSCGPGEPEAPLPSGDRVDVLFFHLPRSIAVEVKPSTSSNADIARGLFQCIKYESVLRAQAAFEGRKSKSEAILVLGKSLPQKLIPLRNSLGIEVIEIAT